MKESDHWRGAILALQELGHFDGELVDELKARQEKSEKLEEVATALAKKAMHLGGVEPVMAGLALIGHLQDTGWTEPEGLF